MAAKKYGIDLFKKLNLEYASKPLVPIARTFDTPALKKEGRGRTDVLVNHFAKVTKVALAGKRVLEIGCGRGNTAFELAGKTGCSVVGVDIVQSPIWPEYESANVSFHKLDISTEGCESLGQFDFIYSFAVWEHMRHPFAALKAARSLLSASGFMYMSANLYRGPKASHRYREVYFPWPHLLFENDVFEEYYKSIARRGGTPAWVNKLVAAEYLCYFDLVGLEAKKVWYSMTKFDEDFYNRFEDKLGCYPKFDLERDFLHALVTPKSFTAAHR
jgi:SAM-dependent methyltransferase